MVDEKQGKYSKNEFLKRHSLLDLNVDDSGINKSPLKGLYILMYLFGQIYTANVLLKKYDQHGSNL